MNNVIDLINEDLLNHRVAVKLPREKHIKLLYLILITAKTSKLKDFQKTYGNEVTMAHLKIAKKVFGEDKTENIYGVFVDENLTMVFAFNREFADYNSKKKTVIFKDIDDLLIDKIEVKKDEGSSFPKFDSKKLFSVPEQGGRRDGGGRGLIKYSLTEKKTKKKTV